MPRDLSREEFERIVGGIDFSDLGEAPEKTEVDQKVFVQKIITEVWVYTDIEGKTFAHTGIQDIVLVGDMKRSEALKMIGDRKRRKKRQ